MATSFTRAETRDELFLQAEEGEQAWRANRQRVNARAKAAGCVALLLASTAGVYGYLTLLADSGVRAMVAVEREFFEPEISKGARAEDIAAQFSELNTRRAFASGEDLPALPPQELAPASPPGSERDL